MESPQKKIKLEKPAGPYFRYYNVSHDENKVVTIFCSFVSKEKYEELFGDNCELWLPVMFASNRAVGKRDEHEEGPEGMYCSRMILKEDECTEVPENVHVAFNGSGWMETGYIIRIKRGGEYNDDEDDDEEEEEEECD